MPDKDNKKPKNMEVKATKEKKKIGFNPQGLLKSAFMRNKKFKALMDALDK